VRLRDVAKQILLLHFWPLASSFFDPVTIVFNPKEKRLVDERQLAPVLVVPDVTHVKHFVNYFLRSISRDFPSPQISTPIEAALAFYVAPRLAHGLAVTEEIFNEFQQSVGGATVFAYRYPMKRNRPDRMKQPEVRAVYEETYTEEMLQAYFELIRQGLNSPPYRSLRVKNLIADRPWHDGFDTLVNEWPLELFVPIKNRKTNSFEWKPKGDETAKDLSADFAYFREMEDDMPDQTRIDIATVPTIIDDLVGRYLNWLVYSRGQNPPDKEVMDKIFAKKRTQSDSQVGADQKKALNLNADEEKALKKYNELKMKLVNQEFVAFRGATNQRRFAEKFIGMFEAGFNLEPQEREMLRPFYESKQWESGRWLTLMAISAASAPRRSTKASTNRDDKSLDKGRSKSNGE